MEKMQIAHQHSLVINLQLPREVTKREQQRLAQISHTSLLYWTSRLDLSAA